MTDYTGSWGTPVDGYSLSSRTEGGLSTLTDIERDERQRLAGQQRQDPLSQEEIKMRKQATESILAISYPEILHNERQLIMIASPPFHEVVPEHLQKTEFSPATMADEINKIREGIKRETKSKYTSNESTNTDKTTTSQTDQSSIEQQATPESQRENEKFKSPQGIKQRIECTSPKAADN
jgi:23S rRNA A1618 N6-methylase RlmF